MYVLGVVGTEAKDNQIRREHVVAIPTWRPRPHGGKLRKRWEAVRVGVWAPLHTANEETPHSVSEGPQARPGVQI